ncbi:MAG: hypothetical protein JSV04_02470 [Candidatus Heimdallarchaeota archaeon]|nr:MAG: hypothetical protein JSV04_02470 [Candidatus Heimdallarchaeota archaeon]
MQSRKRPISFAVLLVMVFLVTQTDTWGSSSPINNCWTSQNESPFEVHWNHTYGGQGHEIAFSVVHTANEGYHLVGQTTSYGDDFGDIWLVKTNSNGVIQWNKTYGQVKIEETALSLIETIDGGFVIYGHRYAIGLEYGLWLLKVDNNGIVQWSQTYNSETDILTEGEDAIQTQDGGFALVGTKWNTSSGQKDAWLIKTDSAGKMQWNQTYGGPSMDKGYSLIQLMDGGYFLVGNTQSYGSGKGDAWLVKTDEIGRVKWNRTFGGPEDDYTNEILQLSDQTYILSGGTESYGAGKSDFWLLKIDNLGTVIWNHTCGGPEDDWGRGIVQTKDGGFALIGDTHSEGGEDTNMWLVKTNENGNVQWNKSLGGANIEQGRELTTTPDGGLALVGETISYGAGGRDMWMVKLTPPAKTFTDETTSSTSTIDTTSRPTPSPDILNFTLCLGLIMIFKKYRRK